MRERRFFLKSTACKTPIDVLEDAKAIQVNCSDYIVKKLNQNMIVDKTGSLLYTPVNEPHTSRKVELGQTALTQICNRFGIPASYMTKCLENDKPDLVANNLNSWIKMAEDDSSALVREYKDSARAFLSTKFSPYDAPDVMENIIHNLNMDDLSINQYFLNEELLQLRMVKKTMLPIPDEDLFAGLIISSSDVGKGSLNVNFYIYKQVCSNGLVLAQLGGKMLHMRHIGINPENFSLALTEVSENFNLLCEKSVDLIQKNRTEFLNEEQMKHILNSLSKDAKIPEKIKTNIIELAKARYAIDADHLTRWDIANGITEIAQKYELDRRTELETFAGKLLVA